MSVLSAILALVVLVLRVMLLGLLLSPPVTAPRAPRADLLPRTGRALFAGVAANLLIPVAFLCGRWTALFDWGWWLVIVVNAARWRVQRRELVPADLRLWLAPTLLVLAAAALVLLLPVRSEWRMGGWDPGFYQNNAVRIAADGRLDGPHLPLYVEAARRDSPFASLARPQYGGTYRALADSLPLAPDGSIPLYFFHLTPIAGAALHRLGGDAFLDRLNGFLAFGALFAFASLLSSLGLRGYRRALPLFFMAISPLWWYHRNIPTSEMLYLFLLLGGAADWLDSRDARRPPWGAWAACFLLVVNHLNAAVLVGALLALATLLEAASEPPLPRRTRLLRTGVALAALALGGLWDAVFARATLLKLLEEGGILPVIFRFSLEIAAAALLFSLLTLPRGLRRAAGWLARATGLLAAVIVSAVALASLSGAARDWFYAFYGRCHPIGQMLWWLMRISPFFPVPALVLAGTGAAVLALHRNPARRRTALALFVFGAACLAVLYNPGIKKLFPWALRRFYAFALPAVAIAQAAPVIWALDASCRKPKRTPFARNAATVLLVTAIGVVLLTLPVTRAAARVGDYRGLVGVLETLRSAIQPGDVVITDNPAWMAPLILAEDIPAVNGERLMDGDDGTLWRTPDPAVRADLLTALRFRAGVSHTRLLWLTTTTDGLTVYPDPPPVEPDPILSLDFPATTVAQGQRNKYYDTTTRTIPLRLYATLPLSPESP